MHGRPCPVYSVQQNKRNKKKHTTGYGVVWKFIIDVDSSFPYSCATDKASARQELSELGTEQNLKRKIAVSTNTQILIEQQRQRAAC